MYTPEEVGLILARSYVLGALANLPHPDISLLERMAVVSIPENVSQYAVSEIEKATQVFK